MRDGIDEDTLLCEACGYVIDGMPRDGQCPECGKAVAESLPERRDQAASLLTLARRPLRTWASMRIEDSEVAGKRTAARCMAAGLVVSFAVVIGWVPWWITQLDIVTALFSTGVSALAAIMAATIVCVLLIVLTWIETCGLRFIGARRGFRVTRDIAGTVCSHATLGWLAGSIVWLLGWILIGAGTLVEMLLPTGVVVVVAGLLVGLFAFEVLAYIGLRRCRFANRHRTKADTGED